MGEPQELTPEEMQKQRDEIAAEVYEDGDQPAKIVSLPDEKDPPEDQDDQPDPWEGVSPALKEMFEGMSKKVESYDSMTNRLRQAEHRIGNLTNELQAAKKAKADVPKKEAPTQKEIDAAAKSDEAWQALREDFPDWADAMDSRIDPMVKQIKALEAKIESLSKPADNEPSEGNEQRQNEADALREQLALTKAHPDWEETAKSQEYADWLKSQPAQLQAKAQSSPYATDAIDVLNQFKAHKSKTKKSAAEIKAERDKRLAASHTPTGKPGGKSKAEQDLSLEEYRAKVAEEVWGE